MTILAMNVVVKRRWVHLAVWVGERDEGMAYAGDLKISRTMWRTLPHLRDEQGRITLTFEELQ